MKILIFKVNQLGDNIVFKPVVDYLTSQPGSNQVFLFTSPTAKALYEEQIPSERLYAFPTRRFNSAWKTPFFFAQLLALVRRIGPDICLLAEDQGNVAHFLSSITGASCRVGSLAPFLRWRWGLTVDVQPGEGTNHALWGWKILKAFVNSTQGEPVPDEPPPPVLSHLSRSTQSFDFLIHAGASLECKQWLPCRFVELANRLASRHRVGWVNAGLPGAAGLSHQVHRLDTPNLAHLVSAIANARVFVGNNSGPMNIAQALGTPSMIFCGPSSINWDPYWHSDRMIILRDTSLLCISCDKPNAPAQFCRNLKKPMACMQVWSVDKAETISQNLLLKLQSISSE